MDKNGYIRTLTAEAVELLKEMVAIPSPSFSEDAVCEHISGWMNERCLEHERIGNNINQIAHKVNSKRFFFGNFNSVIEGQRKIYDAILNLTGDD